MRRSIIGIALILSGCVTEQPANPKMAAKLGEQCKVYGFKPGTDSYTSCVFQLDQNRIASNRQKRMAFARAMSETGAQMQANARNQQMINAMNRPMNCTSTPGMNGVYRTNCY